MKLRIILLSVPVLAAALLLRAAGPLEEKFKELDKNSDGVLSGEELNAAPYLSRMDLNGDG